MKKIIGIIPARFASTRFPGKPLVEIGNKTMIQRVYERASSVLTKVVVATDDERIEKTVKLFGGNVINTSPLHQSGTDRCMEALLHFSAAENETFDIVVNIQGDEPFIRNDQIDLLCSCFDDPKTEIATLIKPISDTAILLDPNRPKVIVDCHNFALYFSRTPVPFYRGIEQNEWLRNHTYYQHIGMYAYRADTLKKITQLPSGKLEKAESLEQLRWLENGYRIKTAITQFETYGIDTPEDLKNIIKLGLIEE